MTRFSSAVRRVDERRPGLDLPLLSVSQTRGVLRQSDLSDRPPRADSLDDYKVCRRGDIVFNKMSIRSGAMGVAPEDGLVTYHYEVMRPISGADSRYLVYLMKSSGFTAELVRRERGIGAGGTAGVRTTEVPFSVLRTIDAYVPEAETQRQIADYLDAQTSKIDALIEKQERLIETLAERRQAVISHAVTKGLDPTAPVRDSGVDWIGLLPTSWTVAPMKWLGLLTTGTTPDTTEETNYSTGNVGFPWVRPEDLRESGAPTESTKLLTDDAWKSTRRVRAGSTLVCCIGATVGKVGIVSETVATNQQITAVSWNGNDRFLFYTLVAARSELVANSVGNTLPILNTERLGRTRLPVPTSRDQAQIVEYIESQTSTIDRLTAKSREMIAVLKERRQALISAAVTGKIDVRGLV